MIRKTATTLALAGLILAGCSKDSPTSQSPTPPWNTGQSADGVLGQPDFVSSGPDSTKRTLIPGASALAVTAAGSLFVIDQRSHRILRFDNAHTKANGSPADGVLGQSDFTTRTWNAGAGGSTPSASGFENPQGVAISLIGHLFVADRGNNRILRFDGATGKANGASADAVLGQINFTSKGFGSSPAQMTEPCGVAVDASGNLFVADRGNNRVLRFNNAAGKANGGGADAVFGQPDFATTSPGTTASKMWEPQCLSIDNAGTLYVGDWGNSRILIFFNAAARVSGASADRVLGKQDFFTGTQPSSATASNIGLPTGLGVDAAGNLYVADGYFNRLLVYLNVSAKPNGAAADAVLGKSSFTDGSTTSATASNVGQPYGAAVHASSGTLFLPDYSNGRVLRFKANSPITP